MGLPKRDRKNNLRQKMTNIVSLSFLIFHFSVIRLHVVYAVKDLANANANGYTDRNTMEFNVTPASTPRYILSMQLNIGINQMTCL